MPFRADLDLSGIPWADQYLEEIAREAQRGAGIRMETAPDTPVLVRHGERYSTPSAEVLPSPAIIYDANGYYTALGFRWPFRGITKKDLREHYQAKNGQASEYLTNAFKLLLDDEFRRYYDRLPVGEWYVDRYARLALNRKAAREASRRNATQPLDDDDYHTIDTVLGITEEDDEPSGDENEPVDDTDQDNDLITEKTWSWGYYAWRSSRRDILRLAAWQSALTRAARELGHPSRFAVGFHGRSDDPWMARKAFDGDFVFYLHEDHDPTDTLAREAVGSTTQMS